MVGSASTTSEPTIYLPMPHAGQQRVLAEMRRFNYLVAGRRWRKTTLAVAVMVERALGYSAEYVWAAPTYKQVRRGWEEMRRACGEVVTFREGLMTAQFPSLHGAAGSVVHFLSMENYDNTRGYTSYGTVIDEASEVVEAAYTTALRPQLFGTDGWLLAMGTPKGRNWFFKEFQLSAAGERGDSAAWRIPTLGATISDQYGLLRVAHPYENPTFSFDELRHEFETLPERVFRQEYLAEFLDDAGGVFRGVEDCVGGELRAGPTHGDERYVIGIDLAKHLDYTVCVVMDQATRHVVAFDRFNQSDWPLQKARIITLAHHWNDALVWMDTTGLGDPIYDDLRLAGLRITPYRFTHQTKDALINNAVLQVEQRTVSYPRIETLIGELKAMEYKRTAAGTLTMNAPEGMHDDAVIAFCLACWGVGPASQARIPRSAVEQMRAPVSEIGGVKILRKRF
jgi:hypothetical protein